MNNFLPLQLPGQSPVGDLSTANIVEMIRKDRAQEKVDAAAAAKEKESTEIKGAGIQAAGQLVSDLFSQAAMQQRAEQQAKLESAKTATEVQAKGLQAASEAQQNAFTRLMGSMRSALVGG